MKENKIPSAEEFLNNYRFKAGEHIGNSDFDTIAKYAMDFAKLHVKAALDAAANNLKLYENMRSDTPQIMKNPFDTNCDFYVDKDSILVVYPEELIKQEYYETN